MKTLFLALAIMICLFGCKEDQQSGPQGGYKIYHTDQPRESVPEAPGILLLACGLALVIARGRAKG